MYSTLRNFLMVNGAPSDLDSLTHTCCNCKKVITDTVYADDIGRIYCPECIKDERIASLYEVAIHELVRYLDRLGIPYEEPEKIHDGFAVRFPWCYGDVACHSGTYGGLYGRMETYCFSTDNGDVTGYLRPLEALEIVLHEWNERYKKMREGG